MATNASIYGSDETSFQDCDVCKFQNIISAAVSYCSICREYMCTVCERVHRGSKITRNHNLFTVSNMSSASTKSKPTSPILFCEDHTTMSVDMYCKTHDEVICSACKITSHRMCEITDVSQQTKQMTKDGSFNKTKTNIADLKTQYDNMKAMRKNDKSIFKSQLEKSIKDMRQIRKEINETLDTIDKTLSEEIQYAAEKTTKEIEVHCAIFDHILSQIKKQLKNLKECEASKDNQVMFIGMNRASIAQHKYADTMAKMQQDLNETETQFKINNTLYDTVRQLQYVETVLVEEQVIRTGITYGLQSQKPLSNMIISGARDIDIGDTYVFGCTFMPDGHLLLCCGHHGLKLLDKEFKMISHLNEYAWCVAAISDTEIIVTQCMFKQMILKVKIFPQMKVSKTIDMGGNCFGVDVYGDEMYLICENQYRVSNEIQVLNIDGKLQRRLGKDMLKGGGNVSINNDGSKVFVSNWYTCTVTCLDTKGHVIYQYSGTDLEYPIGMYSDCDGYLLVCGFDNNNVQVIGPDGKKEKILLSEADGVIGPRCIAFRQSDSCLVVGMENCCFDSLISYIAK